MSDMSDMIRKSENGRRLALIDDGQERWVADADELLAALESLGWREQGNCWIEPAQGEEEESEPGNDPYTDLCGRVSAYPIAHGDIDSLEARLPTLYFRPDEQPNNRVWAWVSP